MSESPGRPGVDTRRLQAAVEATLFGEAPPVRVGRFEILERIGQGGMGVVFKARDPELDRQVAVKLLAKARRMGAATVSAATGRLRREARALARFAHPNVVAILDVGTQDGQTYIAMEYVGGGTLAQWAERNPVGSRRRYRQVLAFFEQAAQGLAAAHRAGVIHCDLKPANLLLDARGRLRLADFGLARSEGAEHPSGTDESVDRSETASHVDVVGTPAYMAPEQHRGLTSQRADQYSLCAAFSEVASGVLRTADAAVDGATASVGELPDVPRPLQRVLQRGMQHDPADRYPSVGALLADLRRIRSSRARRVAVGGAVALALAGLALAWIPGPGAPPCEAGSGAAADLLTPGLQAQLHDALPGQETRAREVSARLDLYGQRWRAAYRNACRGDPAALDRRMACLREGRVALEAFAAQLQAMPGPRAVDAVNALPDVELCATLHAPATDSAAPLDPSLRAEVAAIREAKARLYVEHIGMSQAEAAQRAQALYERAEASSVPLLIRDVARATVVPLRAAGDGRALAMLERAVAAVDQPGSEYLAMDLAALVFELVPDGDAPRGVGVRYMRRAGALLERIEDETLRQRAQRELAFARVVMDEHSGDLERAAHSATTLLPQLEQHGSPSMLADLLHVLGRVKRKLGRYDTARAHLERARQLAEELRRGNAKIPSIDSDLLAVAMEMGDADAAVRYASRVVEFTREYLDPQSPFQGIARANLATALVVAGDRDAARREARAALEILRVRLPESHPAQINARVNLAVLTNDLDARGELVRDALRVALEHHGADSFAYASALSLYGQLGWERGEFDLSVERQRTALATFERLGRPRRAAQAQLELARAELGREQLDAADQAASAALAKAEAVFGGDTPKLAKFLLARAQVDGALGRTAAANERLRRAETLATGVADLADTLEKVQALLRDGR